MCESSQCSSCVLLTRAWVGAGQAVFKNKYSQPDGVNYVHQEERRERNKALWLSTGL